MKCIFRKTVLFLAVLAAGAPLAWALANNLYVGARSDVVSGFDGRPLPDGSGIEFRVMWKAGMEWKAYPPEHELTPSRNPLMERSTVGAGIIPTALGRGQFAACLSGLETNKAYVVRLFDGPTPEESVAYCDSKAFTYDADSTHPATNVTFGVWKKMDGTPLDTETDSDGDGLADSVENLLALTDPDNWDTDGDGFSDGFEYTHGMDPLEAYELAIQLEIESPDAEACLAEGLEPEALYSLSWAALSGRTYRVEFQPTMRPENPEDEWKVIAEEQVPATTNRFMYNLENIEDDGIFEWIRRHSAFFRVRRMASPADGETAPAEVPPGE